MRKIRSKLSLTLLPVVVFPLLALGLQSMNLLEEMSKENSVAQFQLLLRNSQVFLNESIQNNHNDLAFLPQTSVVNRYLSSGKESDNNSQLGPMVQLLFHQMIKSNPGILQIVLVNDQQEEELQAGDGIDPFTAISASNKALLKLMQSQAKKNYTHFMYSPELSRYVFKLAVKFSNNDPELKQYSLKPKEHTLILTYSLLPLLNQIKEQERISGYTLLLIDKSKNRAIDGHDNKLISNELNNHEELAVGKDVFYIEKGNLTNDIALGKVRTSS